ncbi:gp436 family protein [Nitratireductor rhodophyticola]
MAYCTLQELTDRYSQRMLVEISDRADAPSGAVDTDLIDRAIADADALIDGYLKVRYRLPLASIPRLVKDLSLRISIYYAHAHVASDKIRRDYEEALSTLKHISQGLIRLDLDGAEPEASGASEVRTNNPERPITATTMKGYI